jgi:N6-L-threonylcarbamoyladenine synthase
MGYDRLIHPIVHRHTIRMPEAIKRALEDARIQASDLDAIAFTRGPGMNSSLLVSVRS